MHIESFVDVPILSTAGRGIDFLFLFKREMSRAGASRIWYFFSVEKDLFGWFGGWFWSKSWVFHTTTSIVTNVVKRKLRQRYLIEMACDVHTELPSLWKVDIRWGSGSEIRNVKFGFDLIWICFEFLNMLWIWINPFWETLKLRPWGQAKKKKVKNSKICNFWATSQKKAANNRFSKLKSNVWLFIEKWGKKYFRDFRR